MISDPVVPPENNAPLLGRGAEILAQLGEELAFVEAGKDTGLLPINSLLMDFEEITRAGAPANLATGLTAARTLLDQILDRLGIVTRESILYLNQWHAWMSSVLTAWERGRAMPAVPAAWNQPIGGVAKATVPDSKPTPSKSPAPPAVAGEPAIRLNLA